MSFTDDTFNLLPAVPTNTESADALEISAQWADFATGLSQLAARISAITVSFGDITDLPTTLDGYGITDAQALDATLTALAGVTFAADKALYATGDDAFGTFTFVSYMRGLMASADEASFKAAINHTSGLAQTAVVNTFTKAQRTTIVTLADGTTITPDMDDGNDFEVTLGGNRSLANPTNLTAGQSGSIRVIQDGTGSRTLTYGTYWKFTGGTPPTLSTGPGSSDVLHYKVWSTTYIEVASHLDVR